MRALDAVSVDIRRNEFFTLLGPSGCGKTTLLRMIAGFEAPTEGAILLEGADITAEPPFKRPVNTVFQSYALFPHLTVSENIAFGLEMLGRSKAETETAVREMLALVRMEEMSGRLPAQLSGGQQQRVALARALAPRPSVLLLDEPLSALDLKLRQQMQIELKRMQRDTGITFIFVTHDQEEALTMSDRIGVMNGGKILQVGSPQEIYNRPVNRFVASFIGESNFLDAEVVESGRPARVKLAGGVEMAADYLEGETPSGKVTVTVRPEQIVLDPAGGAEGLAGKVTNTLYFGTDLYCYIDLGGGTELVARTPASAGGEGLHKVGDAVNIGFAPGALRIVGG
ncbi:ABC transporter ATP-binding protein [Roseibium aggregatum]|uniref:Spermidine/putrescine import ATP-binding protein PotA n=1 Tax=Roseibium aggregatum TaxID=187304 RepID=A0A939EF66_9HYPH|nr:ABC transporter ATP-binding protein [Roseibium aggregatum]MBN9672122.1 ABC transporter ATP-binding protein [Roseibium aggregatum]